MSTDLLLTSDYRGRMARTSVGLTVIVSVAVIAALLAGTAAARSEQYKTVQDPAGDVKSGDLDLRAVKVTRAGGSLTLTFTVRQSIRNNVIYSAMLTVSGHQVQIAAKRAAGANSFFVFRFSDAKNIYVKGSIKGRVASVRAPVSVAGVGSKPFRFSATAEPTNGRSGGTDRAPNGSRTVLMPGVAHG